MALLFLGISYTKLQADVTHIFLNPTFWQRKGTQISFYKASALENCPNIILIKSTVQCRFCKSNWFLGWFFKKVEKLTIFLKALQIEFVIPFHVFGQEHQEKQKVGSLKSIVWNTPINWLSIHISLFILWCESLKEIMMYWAFQSQKWLFWGYVYAFCWCQEKWVH